MEKKIIKEIYMMDSEELFEVLKLVVGILKDTFSISEIIKSVLEEIK